ncbi:MAG TPA: hypothetical protein VGO93_13310 [Candidatus Xenobia bacterium]
METTLQEHLCSLPQNAGELLDLEQSLHQAMARQVTDRVVGQVIVAALESEDVRGQAAQVQACVPHLHLQDRHQTVTIALLGGTTVTVEAAYYLRRPPRGPGRVRARGRRGRAGNGMYPRLEVLGLGLRASPALASEAARLAAMGTIDSACETLAMRGVNLSRKVFTRLYRSVGQRGLSYREWLMANADRVRRNVSLAGKRVLIGTDGGRLRTKVCPPAGRRRKSGRQGFEGVWREPKVLVIHEIDAAGRKVRKGVLYYDATMRDADGLFDLLVGVLLALGAHKAVEWVFAADGAEWIWNRVATLVTRVGFTGRLTEVVDFYHAAQHLHAMASARNWSKRQTEAWTKRMRRFLKKGDIGRILEEAESICKGRTAGAIRTEMEYFKTHRHRMDYQRFRQLKIPIGSGAVESCVRRLVNLRMKGNGIFWREECAEDVLLLRARLLSGTWSPFIRTILSPSAPWS